MDGDSSDESQIGAGAAYAFKRTGSDWAQTRYIKASNTSSSDGFGSALALAADGQTLAVSAIGEAGMSTGVQGDQASDAAPGAGAVYLY